MPLLLVAQDSRFGATWEKDTLWIKDNLTTEKLLVKPEWIDEVSSDFFEYKAIDSSDVVIPSFEISDGQIVLILPLFRQSGKFATGFDFFLVYDDAEKKLANQTFRNDQARWIGPGPCRGGVDVIYLISDVNGDGVADVGIVEEQIKCDWEDDMPATKQYFLQSPPIWYVREEQQWSEYSFGVGSQKIDQMITVMYPGPLDVTGFGLWKSYNPSKWNTKQVINHWPIQRVENCLKEAREQDDQQMINFLLKKL